MFQNSGEFFEFLKIFDNFGEKKFREMESAYFVEKSKQKNYIFSTGGGIVLEEKNRNILFNDGITILLEANCDILLHRIKDSTDRPLISESNNLSLWFTIAAERLIITMV